MTSDDAYMWKNILRMHENCCEACDKYIVQPILKALEEGK